MGIFDFLKAKKKQKVSGLPECPQEIIDEQKEIVIEQFINGDLESGFETNLLLKKDEKLIFDLPNIGLAEETTTKASGAYLGASIRIMKGVSLRPGKFSGGSEKEVAKIDEGPLTLTDKRMVFTGDRKSREFKLTDINSIFPTSTGIALNRKRKTKTEYYLGTAECTISLTIHPDIEGVLKVTQVEIPFDGPFIKKVIEGLIRKQ